MNQKKASRMEAIVQGFADYEGSKKSYCESHKIKPHVFDYYRKKLSKTLKGNTSFVPIQIKPSVRLKPIRINYANGNQLTFSVDTPLAVITQLLQIRTETTSADV